MDLIFNNHIVKVINRDSEPFFYGSELKASQRVLKIQNL